MSALRGWLPFLAVVLAPTALAAIYFGLIAADRYVAEAQFVVRSAERSVPTGVGALLQSAGLGPATDDAFLVRAYMQSRDAMLELDRRVDFRGLMGREEADFLARWPNVVDGETTEGLYDYFQRRVTVVHDLATGISTLTVHAFSGDDARFIASTLLLQGEDFVNRMNERAMTDTVDFARREVELAEARVRENQEAFTAFRTQAGLVSPVADSDSQMELVARLSAERASLEAEARRIETSARNSPQLPALRSRISAVNDQIAEERSRLVGGSGALSERYGQFETLLLEQEFAADALLAARAGLEQARAEAQRKQRYLAVVVHPGAPDEAREPRRLVMTLSVAASCFLLYAIGWLLWVNAREHAG
ncbi:hypothetical protein [Rubrimonas sp.]|uniref:hypothetical protein n=1 Tax=Rubrimonas sp. TaxID=2036015 RepID=UPI002FDE9E38